MYPFQHQNGRVGEIRRRGRAGEGRKHIILVVFGCCSCTSCSHCNSCCASSNLVVLLVILFLFLIISLLLASFPSNWLPSHHLLLLSICYIRWTLVICCCFLMSTNQYVSPKSAVHVPAFVCKYTFNMSNNFLNFLKFLKDFFTLTPQRTRWSIWVTNYLHTFA